MNIKQTYSTKATVDEVVLDLKSQLQGFNTKLLIFFASSAFCPETLGKQMQAGFAAAAVFGCTTAGEIIGGQMLKNSVVAMAFNGEAIQDVAVQVVENIRENGDVIPAFAAFHRHFGQQDLLDHFDRYVGMVLIDGLSTAEEKIMDRIGNASDLIFIGGSAGDDLQFKTTYVFAHGKAYTNAAILAILKTVRGYDLIKTQSFTVLEQKLTATKVNMATREVIEFNHRPAVEAYAAALGVDSESLDQYFMTNPLALVADNEIYVRSPQQIKDDHLILYCNILNGMEVTLLQATDIVKDTQAAIAAKKQELGHISGMINFHCILRTLELEQKGQSAAYAQLFAQFPTIGFSTYGEQYVGHINQTSTILVFK